MPSDLTERRVRDELISYLKRPKSLKRFYAWFAPATLGVDQQSPAGLRELVYGIKLYLAEYSRGHRTQKDLCANLLVLLRDSLTRGSERIGSLTRGSELVNKVTLGSGNGDKLRLGSTSSVLEIVEEPVKVRRVRSGYQAGASGKTYAVGCA